MLKRAVKIEAMRSSRSMATISHSTKEYPNDFRLGQCALLHSAGPSVVLDLGEAVCEHRRRCYCSERCECTAEVSLRDWPEPWKTGAFPGTHRGTGWSDAEDRPAL